MRKIFLIIILSFSCNVQAQKFYDVSNKKELILSSKNTSDVFIIKLRASTLEPADEEIILECWTEEIFKKPQVLNGKTFNKKLVKYKINKRQEEFVLIQSVGYNSKGSVVFNYEFDEFDYKGAIPNSFGEKIIEEASLLYEIVMLAKTMEKED